MTKKRARGDSQSSVPSLATASLLHQLPGSRLVTQNLLISASTYERERAITGWALSDLCSLIDTFVFSDRAITLSRPDKLDSGSSPLLDAMFSSGFLEVMDVGNANLYLDKVSTSARGHLLAFLGSEENTANTERVSELLRNSLRPSNASLAVTLTPDTEKEIGIATRWLKESTREQAIRQDLATERNVARGRTFLFRTFWYAGVSEVFRLPFTPDAVRLPVVDAALDSERNLRQRIAKTIKIAWADEDGFLANAQLARAFTPMATVVFKRAKGDRAAIPAELQELRERLTPFRHRLSDAEQQILGSHKSSQAAKKEWLAVIKQLEKAYGTEPHVVSVAKMLGMAGALATLADSPSSLAALVAALVMWKASGVRDLWFQGPAFELHRLRLTLDSLGGAEESARKLFGQLR
jgi:hypothetical protein